MNTREITRLVHFLHECVQMRESGDGKLPAEVFEALLKLVPLPAIETVICRRSDDGTRTGNVEVLLIKRPDDAPAFPGQWHVPGSFIRSKETVDDVVWRISADELNPAIISRWQFVGIQNNNLEPRGHTYSTVLRCSLHGEPARYEHRWVKAHPALLLESDMVLVDHHYDLIQLGIQPLLMEPFFR